jgi:hypothetical protein
LELRQKVGIYWNLFNQLLLLEKCSLILPEMEKVDLISFTAHLLLGFFVLFGVLLHSIGISHVLIIAAIVI